jgi:phosphatidate cytidylyltransferase
MLGKRVLVAAIGLPIGLAAVYVGGYFYSGLITLILSLAAYEYARLFITGGYRPSIFLVVSGTALLAAFRAINGFQSGPLLISLVLLAAMAYHLIAYERGREQAGTDFAITAAGPLYLGWIGAYLISLRDLPDGMWWVLLVLPAVWLADSAAYFVGRRFGRHKLSPRLSPGKTWEGYWGGVIAGTLGTCLLAWIYQHWSAGPLVTPLTGAVLGFVLSLVTPLGDLGKSMIKRQVGVKDSGHLIPGHGGVFDRIDTWLWAGVIGYYLIVSASLLN